MAAAKNPDPNTILPERAPALAPPLRFFLTGLLFLVALLGLSVWKAPMIAMDYLHNTDTLAVLHLFTLGFGGLVVTGAIYQITPVLLYSQPRSAGLINLHLVLQTAGTILLVAGFLRFQTGWMALGGSLVAASSLVFLGNVLPMFRAVERWNWHGVLMATAIFNYTCTIALGMVLALNLRYGFLRVDNYAPLAAHLALGLGGWFSLMIVGVGLKLVPMFAPAKPLPRRFVGAVGGALALGVLLFLAGLPLGHGWLWPGALLMAAAGIGYALGIAYSFIHRRPGPLDFSVRFAVTAAALLTTVALTALAGLAGIWTGRQTQAGLAVLFLLAWIGGTIIGMLLRILPFMVWLHRFRNRVDRQEKTPFLHEMYHPAMGWVTYFCWFPGTVLMAAGISFGASLPIAAGALVCLVGVAAFGCAMGQVLYHVRPGGAALYPGRK